MYLNQKEPRAPPFSGKSLSHDIRTRILQVLELYVSMLPLGYFSVKTIVLDVFDDLGETLGEFRKIFLVQENLVFVVRKRAVGIGAALALGDCEIIIILPSGGLYIKEISPFSGLHRF